MENESKICYWSAHVTASFLLGIYALSFLELVCATPLFHLNIPILLGALIIAAVAGYRAHRSISSGIFIFFLVLGIGGFVSASILDTSFDGIRYHAAGIIAVSDSYNFIYDLMPHVELGEGYSNWVALYPKLTWVLGANFFLTTGVFETAKVINFLGLLLAFGFAYPLFRSFGIHRFRSCILAITLAVNPISVAQMLSNLQDGFLSSLLIGLVCLLIFQIRVPNSLSTVSLAMLVVLIVITKTTGVVFVAIFLGSSFIWSLAKGMNLRWHLILMIALGIGFFGFGYAPYTKSLIRTGNPFHGVLGKGAAPIMEGQLPAEMKDENSAVLFVSSLFSRTIRQPNELSLKIPGMVTFREVRETSAASRLGGFGPLFSLAVVLSIVGIVLCLSRNCKLRSPAAWLILTLLSATLIHPAAWWARYVPHFYLFPFIYLTCCAAAVSSSHAERWIWNVTIGVIIVNIAIFAYPLGRDVMLSKQMKNDLEAISQRSGSGHLVIYDRLCKNVKGPVLIRKWVHAESSSEMPSSGNVEENAGVVFSIGGNEAAERF